MYEWNAIFAPAGTPAPIVAKLYDAIARALQSADVRERIASLGGEIAGLNPAETARFVREQTELWSKVVRAGGIKPE